MQELRGMPVVSAMSEKIKENVITLATHNIIPTLSIVRVGEREDDLSYERGAIKRFTSVGAQVKVVNLPINCTQTELEDTITNLNSNRNIHGILIFRPLPNHLSEDNLKKLIAPEKDVDCFGNEGYASLFIGDNTAYPPCTPQAVIELLDYYNIDVCGKKITIVGRSLVVGKPLFVMLLAKNATVTVCHTRTQNLADECKRADILIASAGSAKMVTTDYVSANQIVIDVGINMDGGKLCGDVDYENVSPIVKAITPVPGGIGTITTSVLLKHTVANAVAMLKNK
jgi:5,10-methylene-tetrahydrofolate dehydrogenase/Methenyl tetrahydrofolate cyclohydrolase